MRITVFSRQGSQISEIVSDVQNNVNNWLERNQIDYKIISLQTNLAGQPMGNGGYWAYSITIVYE